MAIQHEPVYSGDFLKFEAFSHVRYARELGVLKSGQNLKIGTVLGKVKLGTVTSAAKSGGNTGNGTLTLDPSTPLLANAIAGVYTVRVVSAATNAATIRVTNPRGFMLGDFAFNGSGGVASFADQIKLTVTDGSADFAVGDGFDVTVADGSGKWTQLAPGAFDGSQDAAGFMISDVDASTADKKMALITHDAILATDHVIWPVGITTTQKNTAIAQLAALKLILRAEA